MQNYNYGSFKSKRFLKQKKKNSRKIWIILIFIAIAFFLFKFFNSGSKNKDSQPVAAVEGITSKPSESEPIPSGSSTPLPSSLKEVIEKSLEETTGTYGVVVKNLKTGESYSFNPDRSFEAGSLYKLWIMASVVNKIEKGELEGDLELSRSISALNHVFDIDPELAEQTTGAITLTVDQALNQMITISHNYAALLLTEKIKLSFVASYLDSKGLKNSKVGTDGSAPTTTPGDIAVFMEKLYKGELGNSDSTNKMIGLLKDQQLNNKLPLNLPQGTIIAHKTGELGWFSHDAGIVYTPRGNYIIVAMSESSSPAGAEERIAQLSKAVYDYFEK